ncbi:MAG: TonB-dependent receptor domain-containing protein, partial [Phenylobacterium sp.]
VQFNGSTSTSNPALVDNRTFNTNIPQRVRLSNVNSFTTNFVYHFPSIDVKYVGGYQEYNYDLYGDTDATSVKSYQIPLNPGSICGTIGGLFSAGLRYTQDNKFGTEFRRIVCNSDACYPGLYPALGLGAFRPGTAANWGSLLGDLNSVAKLAPVFGIPALAGLNGLGNGAMDLTDSLAPKSTNGLIPGVSSPGITTNGVVRQYVIDPATGIARRNLDGSSNAVTGTLGVQWEPDSETMAYARYSRGYKAFGFSAGGFLAAPKADEEIVNSYEIGFKKDFERFQLNLAAFYLDYRDLQAPVAVRVGATNVTQFVNIDKSESYGVEFSGIWRPVDPLRLTLDYGWNPTNITKRGLLVDVNDNVNTGAVSIVGNDLPQAPEQKVAVNGTYTFETDAGNIISGASYLYRSKSYANVFSREYNSTESWDPVDLRALWMPTGGKYTLIAYVKNAFDTDGYAAAVAASQRNNSSTVPSDKYLNGARNFELTPPRIFGLEVQYRF